MKMAPTSRGRGNRVFAQSRRWLRLLQALWLPYMAVSLHEFHTRADYDYYDLLRNNPALLGVNATANLNVTFTSGSNVAFMQDPGWEDEEPMSIRLVNFASFIPFAGGARMAAVPEAAVVLMALYHLNHPQEHPILSPEEFTDCNIRFTTDFYDTRLDEVHATKQMSALLDRPAGILQEPLPAAVVGSYRSSVTQPQSILAALQDIPQISPASTSANLDDMEVYPYFARTCPSSDGEVAAIVDYYVQLGISKVSILYYSDSFGAALQRAFQERANAIGLETNNVGFLGNENVPDAIAALKTFRFQHIFVVAFDNSYETIMEEAYKAGMAGGAGQYAWMFYGLEQYAIHEAAVYAHNSPLALASKGVGMINFEATEQTRVLEPGNRIQEAPLPTVLESGNDKFRYIWSQFRHDRAFQDFVKSKMPAEVEIDWESFMLGNTVLSIWAYFIYDAVTAMGLAMCRSEEASFIAEDVMPHLDEISFAGASGQVEFNEFWSRRYSTIQFTVWNLIPEENEDENEIDESGQQRFLLSPTDSYSSGEWKQLRPFVYANEETSPPASLIPITSTVDTVNDPIRWIGISLGIIMLVFYIGCLIWAFCFVRQEAVVRSSQLGFLSLVAIGSLVQTLTIIPMSWDRSDEHLGSDESRASDRACMAVPWLYSIGLALTCAAFYAKTYRLVEILRIPELDRLMIGRRDFILWPCFTVGLNVILLSIWTVVSPLHYDVVPDGSTDLFGRSLSSYGVCQAREGFSKPNWFWLSLLLLNVVGLLIANFFTYQTRSIETEYRESQYIAFSLGTIIEAYVIGSAMQHATRDSPDANYVITLGTITLTSFLSSALIFLPKMAFHREDLRRRDKQRRREMKKARVALTASQLALRESSLRDEDIGVFSVSDDDSLSSHDHQGMTSNTRNSAMSSGPSHSLQSNESNSISTDTPTEAGRVSGVKITQHPHSSQVTNRFTTGSDRSGGLTGSNRAANNMTREVDQDYDVKAAGEVPGPREQSKE